MTPEAVPVADDQVVSLVSVVIPCHNYGRFLGAAIESVRLQSYRSIELIVVDDGSTDDSAEVAGRYPDVVCIRQPNRGVAAAANRGLEAAHGEFVLFLDADDELTPGAVEGLARRLHEQSDCAFAYGHVEHVDAEGVVIHESPSRTARQLTCLEGDPYAYMLRTNNCLRGGGAVLYRTDVLREAGGFTLGLGHVQDLDLNLRLARERSITCFDRVVLHYRFHGENSTTRFGAMLRSATLAQRAQREFVSRHPQYRQDYRAGLVRAQSYWGSRLARRVLGTGGGARVSGRRRRSCDAGSLRASRGLGRVGEDTAPPVNEQTRIFGIGLSRTGTVSLTRALGLLGVDARHYPNDAVTKDELRHGRYSLSILAEVQALFDIPVAPYYAQFDALYPDAKFILTTRPEESWLVSMESHFRLYVDQNRDDFDDFVHACVYGALHFSAERFRYVKRLHEQNVRDYFSDRPDKLLVFDLFAGDSWAEICSFLELPVPDEPFPHRNPGLATSANPSRGRLRRLRSWRGR